MLINNTRTIIKYCGFIIRKVFNHARLHKGFERIAVQRKTNKEKKKKRIERNLRVHKNLTLTLKI